MLCEMVGGYNPFTSNNIQQTFENIITLNINWPKNISKQCKKLLETIFVVDPNLRANLFDIKHDPFFKEISNWKEIEKNIPADVMAQLIE